MNHVLRWSAAFLLLSAIVFAQNSSSARPAAEMSSTTAGISASDVKELRQALAAQQQQIAAQQQQIKKQQEMLDRLSQALQTQSGSQAVPQKQAARPASEQAPNLGQVASTTPILPAGSSSDSSSAIPKLNADTSAAGDTQQPGAQQSPLAIRFKGITLTPGGFLAAETVYRNRGLGADVNTPFNSITMPGASQNHLSEFYGSGRQSRISLLAEGSLKNTKLTGYFETDWLSSAITSNNNQSNSYSNRQRQIWGQAAVSGWSFTGGQMWSLVTETKKGLDNRTEALPMTIDAQYHVGFSWARQYGFRVVRDFGDKIWLGVSVENPQATLTAHGNSQNFVIGEAGSSGGLYNPSATYAFNLSPDIIGKVAFEPGFGHYEIFGIVDTFRDRIFPCASTTAGAVCGGMAGPSAAGAFNNSQTGGGVGANARVSVLNKRVDFAIHFLGGNGVGRYGTTGLPDVTVRPDGVLSLIRSYQALGTLEWHSPKFDIYLNGGGEYAGRAFFLNSAKKPVGYGAPGFNNSGCFIETPPGTPTSGQFPTSSAGFLPGALANCTGDTRNIIEGTFGFWYKPYNGTKGRIQLGPQYSYVVRNTWAGKGGTPNGIDNMVFTSFRYYLP